MNTPIQIPNATAPAVQVAPAVPAAPAQTPDSITAQPPITSGTGQIGQTPSPQNDALLQQMQGSNTGQTPAATTAQPGAQTQTSDQGSAQGTPQGAKSTDLSKSPAQTPQTPPINYADPAVQKASKLNQIATVLTGGPHFTTKIDPVSGQVTRTQNQVSTKGLLLAVAMEALGGAAAGLQAKGPGNEGKAFGMGFQNGAQNAQAAQKGQQEQDQQASSDLARQAAVTATNFTTHANAMKAGQMDYDQHNGWVKDSASVVENLRNVGAVQASGVAEGDLMSKYHVTKDMAIPDGVVARIGADGKQAKNSDGSLAWDNTYTVVDPTAKIQLPEDTAQMLADYRVPGSFKMVDGKAVPQDFVGSAPIKAGIVVDMLQKAAGIKLTQGQFDQQFKALNDGDDEGKFQANLKESLADGSLTTKGLQTIGRYSSLPLNQIVPTMQKDKVPADVIGQFMSLVPQGAIEKAKINQTNQESDAKSAEARQNLVVSPSNFEDVLAAKDKYSPDQVKAAQSMETLDAKKKAQQAYSAGASHEQAVIDTKKRNGIPLTTGGGGGGGGKGVTGDMVNDPKVAAIPFDPNDTTIGADGSHAGYMKSLEAANPNLAAEVQAVGEGRVSMSKYGLAKGDGQKLQAIVSRAFPSYDMTKAESYDKARKSFTSGADATQIEAGNTTMLHASELYHNIDLQSKIPQSTWAATRNQDVQQLVEEVNSAYTKGVLHEEKRQALETDMNSVNPLVAKAAVKEVMKLLNDKVGQKAQTWSRAKPSKVIPDFQIITPEAANAYHQVTGKDIDTRYLGIPTDDFSTGDTDNSGVHLLPAPAGSVHTLHGSDGNLYYVNAAGQPTGYAMKNK
jgi:hypothetical protein